MQISPLQKGQWEVSFSDAFPGRGYSYLFSTSIEEEEPSTPTDQETRAFL